MFSRHQLKREAGLAAEDLVEIDKCRRPQNRLSFAYQVAFVRLLNRFPQQQGFEVIEDLVNFSALQLGIDAALIDQYRKRQPTISEHQQTITSYLGLRTFDAAEATLLERFVFEESCRHERTVALHARAKEFLKEQRILEPAEFRIARIVGEQRKAAGEHIFGRSPRESPATWRPRSTSCWWSRKTRASPDCRVLRPTPASRRSTRCSCCSRSWP